MEFNSFAAFAMHLSTLDPKVERAMKESLEKIGKHVEKVAKSEFGMYQPAVGPFKAWEELSPVTKKDRVDKGFTPNDPLLRSGKLRESIGHKVDGHTVVIGSTDEAMVTQELGGYLTDRNGNKHVVPPRSVLGPSVIRSEKFIKETAGHATVSALLPPGSLVPHGPAESDYSFGI